MGVAAVPRKKPRQERAKITVNAILEAAARIWTTADYALGSTNVIAERAGVSVGSLYQYFPDKTALLVALHEREHAQLMARMTAAAQAGAPSLEAALRAVIGAATAHHRENAALVRMLARHLPRTVPAERVESRALQTALRELLRVHRIELKSADPDMALFFMKSLGRAIMQAAAEERAGDLANGVIERELLATVMASLTGRRE